jgi:hypothetical protein
MTSWPPAIEFVPAAVRSILEGSVLPHKVVLYLAEPQFPGRALPDEIEALKARSPLFEVRWTQRDIRSYKKLVPALADFPDDIIVTVDDDILFPEDTLEKLLLRHREYPDMIIAHNVRRMATNRRGILKGYFHWPRYRPAKYRRHPPLPGYNNLLFGGVGVLYPPRSLDAAMLDPELFMAMAPTVDDVWFWAAATSQGTKVVPVPFGNIKLRALGKPAEIALGTGNTRSGVDVNRNVVIEILKKYPLVRRRLEESVGRPVNLAK